jgi:hypothetical protein
MEGKRPLGWPRSRWVDNVEMELKRDRMGVVWTELFWLRAGTRGAPLNTVMNFQFPQNVGKFLCSCKVASSQGRAL